MPAERLRVVLLWHMHQPVYREPLAGRYLAPWTYLHGIKDYSDMATHLEDQPGAAAVVNFSPALLEQLEDYCRQLEGFLGGHGSLRDPLLAALGGVALPSGIEERRALLSACLMLQRQRMVEPYAPFRLLAEMADWMLARPAAVAYIEAQFLADLLVWYHLSWLGETVRRAEPRAIELMAKGRGYTAQDRRTLLALIHDVLKGIVPRYRALAQDSRIELSMNPYAHPILPLLLDFNAAREARPDLSLPESGCYPDGATRAEWHLERGKDIFGRSFGAAPSGCWPSEGAVSRASVSLLGRHGLRWAATGQRVLQNSLGVDPIPSDALHRAYQFEGSEVTLFFRDDELSDLVGFRYKDWHADDAVADLTNRLAAIAEAEAEPGRVVTIALDGENAWEHYPNNGYFFLSALYRALSQDARFDLTTFSRCVEDAGVTKRPLPQLVAGSWVYGDLTTWMGDPDKNRAWDMLVDAKSACHEALESRRFSEADVARIEQQLAVCEGSDWFWWPGDYNPEGVVAQFEHLYRLQLQGLYDLLKESPPDYLGTPFSRGKAGVQGGVMRPGS
ncbi:MAG TPA: glycoside hydrolase family 57 protein [Gammaproteobacteria bacterium]|nr:glycoside hydrolase family 57 protein [Gammaproteobacteria bacterium]